MERKSVGLKHLTSLGCTLLSEGKFEPPVQAIPFSIPPILGIDGPRAVIRLMVGVGIVGLFGGVGTLRFGVLILVLIVHELPGAELA